MGIFLCSWSGPDEGPAAPRVPFPCCSKRQIQVLMAAGNPQPRALGFCENMDFPQNLVFPVPRQLLLLQDSFLPVPLTEFAQCYFLIFIFFYFSFGDGKSCEL